MPNPADLKLVFKLIEQSTSLAVVSDFLKAKALSHSAGSWSDMYSLRIEPAIRDNKLAIADLVNLLRSVEEYGQQHIFLFRAKTGLVGDLMDRSRITKILKSQQLEDLLAAPRLFDQPSKPTFVDVRWHGENKVRALVLKEVLTRESFEFIGETDDGSIIKKSYQRVTERSVNVAVLRSSGELEIEEVKI